MRKKVQQDKVSELSSDEKSIRKFYDENREPFVRYLLKHYPLRREEIEDLYQEAFIALHQNIQSGRLKELTGALSTYLLQIGIYKAKDRFKSKEHRMTDYLENKEWMDWNKFLRDDLENDLKKEQEVIIYEMVSKMESPCKEILFGYYYDDYSMETLATQLGYKDASVAKASKYKCMQKIRNVVRNAFRTMGFCE